LQLFSIIPGCKSENYLSIRLIVGQSIDAEEMVDCFSPREISEIVKQLSGDSAITFVKENAKKFEATITFIYFNICLSFPLFIFKLSQSWLISS